MFRCGGARPGNGRVSGMCFSATASFLAAAVTGAAGVAALARVGHAREIPLALIPLAFATQQLVEGALWLTLPVAPAGGLSSSLTQAFLVYSLAFWPVFAPFTAWSMETVPLRRVATGLCLALGIALAAYFATTVLAAPHTSCISGGHIVYQVGIKEHLLVGLLYLAATGGALAISSHRAVSLLGTIVIAGSVTAYLFYWSVFISVWCFFAAVCSVVILLHFERARAARRAAVSAARV
jgi:hypothetical protein